MYKTSHLQYFTDENHAQFSSDIPNDHGPVERSDRSELERSFGENDQNRAQNVAPNDPNDPNDTLRSSQEGSPSPSYPGAEVGTKIREEMRRMTEDKMDARNKDEPERNGRTK